MANPTRKDLRARMNAVKEEIANLNGRVAALKDERRNLAATLRGEGDQAEKPIQNKAKADTSGKTAKPAKTKAKT